MGALRRNGIADRVRGFGALLGSFWSSFRVRAPGARPGDEDYIPRYACRIAGSSASAAVVMHAPHSGLDVRPWPAISKRRHHVLFHQQDRDSPCG